MARYRFGRWDKYLIWLRLKAPKTADEEKLEDEEERREREQRAAKPLPLLSEVLLILPIVFLYALARGYMMVEVFVSLRVLPLGAYDSVEVAEMIPHW